MMRQWGEFKAQHAQHILLFRMGDFYELFHDDARTASAVLSLTLTSRLGVAMCGFPHFSLSTHLRRLLAAGHSVAVCDQTESSEESRERKSSLVQRSISRIVTRGTLMEEGYLNPKQFNFLLALTVQQPSPSRMRGAVDAEDSAVDVGLCWVDVSTGVLEHRQLSSWSALTDELARVAPAEVLLPQSMAEDAQLKAAVQGYAVTTRPDAAFSTDLTQHIDHWQQRAQQRQRQAEQREADEEAADGASQPTASASTSPIPSSTSAAGEGSISELHPADLLLRCGPVELSACAAVLDYLVYTQRSAVPRLFSSPDTSSSPSFQQSMSIDAATRRSLELTHSLSRSSRLGSLLHSIDHTVTSAGGRLLSSYLSSPLTDIRAIDSRLDLVNWFVQDRLCMETVRATLKECDDIQRGLQRVGMRKGGGGAREMRGIVKTIHKAAEIARCMRDGLRAREGREGSKVSSALLPLLSLLSHPSLESLASLLDRALVDEPPLLLENGHFIRHSYHPPLSTLSSHSSSTQQRITELQQSLRQALSIPLKIKRNTGIGYYIEVSAARAVQLEERRRAGEGGELMRGLSLFQQLKAEWRYKSRDLIGLQNEINNAGEEMLAMEMRVYEELREAVMAHASLLSSVSQALSALDVYSGLAHLAMDMAYVRPTLVDAGVDGEEVFEVVGGRHPVVESRMHALYREREKERKQRAVEEGQAAAPGAAEAALVSSHPLINGGVEDDDVLSPSFSTLYSSSTPYVDFTPNDCSLRTSSIRLWLLTGPNMAGKSTFLRQNALLALMASIGSFVPATSLTLTPIDRLFSRIGGSVTDDLSRDQSTFMSEMLELASILRQATSRSLVIVDEVGRGTSTFDGLSIALAALEFLHSHSRCRCLFATHYHELAEAKAALAHLDCHKMEVEEEGQERGRGGAAAVSFLHRVVPGVVSSSYGLHVARMAGLPASVSRRAEQVLTQLEGGKQSYKQLVHRVISEEAQHHTGHEARTTRTPTRTTAAQLAI